MLLYDVTDAVETAVDIAGVLSVVLLAWWISGDA